MNAKTKLERTLQYFQNKEYFWINFSSSIFKVIVNSQCSRISIYYNANCLSLKKKYFGLALNLRFSSWSKWALISNFKEAIRPKSIIVDNNNLIEVTVYVQYCDRSKNVIALKQKPFNWPFLLQFCCTVLSDENYYF